MKKFFLSVSVVGIFACYSSNLSQAKVSFEEIGNINAVNVNYSLPETLGEENEQNRLNRRYDRNIQNINKSLKKSVNEAYSFKEDSGFTDVSSQKFVTYQFKTFSEKFFDTSLNVALSTATYYTGQFYGTAVTEYVIEKASRKIWNFVSGEVPKWSFSNFNRWTACKDLGIKASSYGAGFVTSGLDYAISKFKKT